MFMSIVHFGVGAFFPVANHFHFNIFFSQSRCKERERGTAKKKCVSIINVKIITMHGESTATAAAVEAVETAGMIVNSLWLLLLVRQHS